MKKKILFVIKNLQGGGAEKVLLDVLNNIDLNKFDVTLFLLRYEGPYLESVNPNIKIIYDTKKINSFYCEKLQIRFIKYLPKIYYWLKIKEKYDVEIGFLEGLPIKIIANSLNKNSKKIGWVHIDLLEKHWTKRFYLNLKEENKCFNILDKIVFVSNSAKEAFMNLFPENKSEKVVIYNPIIIDDIIRKSNAEKVKFNEFTILAVGRLNKQKGFDRLIKAHSKCVSSKPHKLIILGEGEEKENLQQIIKDTKVSNSVEIVNFKKNPYPYIKAADLFVCSSRSEGFSLVVAEALILNKPIISTAVTGPIELLEDGKYGMIVENSEEGIFNGINKLVNNKDKLLYYSEKTKERIQFFNYKKIIQDIESLLCE